MCIINMHKSSFLSTIYTQLHIITKYKDIPCMRYFSALITSIAIGQFCLTTVQSVMGVGEVRDHHRLFYHIHSVTE